MAQKGKLTVPLAGLTMSRISDLLELSREELRVSGWLGGAGVWRSTVTV